jgi:branched-chain amino acid transport system substrate-binding protein
MKKLFTVSLIVFLTFFLASGCGVKKSNDIKIGAILPLTGDLASYGMKAKNGMDMAFEEINSQKDNNFKIAVDYQDDKGKSNDAATIMVKFCSVDKYQLVVGGAASSESMAMLPIANQNKVVQISTISSSPELSGKDYFFRICPSDAYQAEKMAQWVDELKIKSVNILYINNSWGKSLFDRFKESFTKKGGEIKDIETLNEGEKDFRTRLSKIISSNPEAIYCISYGVEGGLILKQLKELGYSKNIFGADVWGSPELLTGAGNAAEGVYLIKPADYKDSTYQKFVDKYHKKFNKTPDVYAAYAYDLAYIISNAFNKTDKTGEQIMTYLFNMPEYEGVTGVTKFDENGDCNTKSFVRIQIVDGKFVEVK